MNSMAKIFTALVPALAAAALLCPMPAAAQDWPVRPVTLVVPFAAGGPIDSIGRILAASLSALLGQQMIVENVGGAGGMTGTARVAKGRTRWLPGRAR
jgi:tripartite-type tricarboxylate transporter receptor subunit TctC